MVYKLHGWNRIYLFYGLIFFLLGFGACCLDKPFIWRRLAGDIQVFTADLGSFVGWERSSANADLAVMAKPATVTVCFLYPHPLLTGCLASVLSRCRQELEQQKVNFKLQGVTEDFDKAFHRWVCENPGSIIIGLNSTGSSASGNRKINLKFRKVNLDPVPLLEQAVAILKDRPLLTFRLQGKVYDCLEIIWEEAETVDSDIPDTVKLLLKALQVQATKESSGYKL